MDKDNIKMEDVINNQCALIIEMANHILLYKEMLEKNTVDSETAKVLPSYIDEYTNIINEATNNSAEIILKNVIQLNNAQKEMETAKNNRKREGIQGSINVLTKIIREKIVQPDQKISEEKVDEISKTDSFRESQKVDIDPVSQAYQISKMCEEHQRDLKSKEDE